MILETIAKLSEECERLRLAFEMRQMGNTAQLTHDELIDSRVGYDIAQSQYLKAAIDLERAKGEYSGSDALAAERRANPSPVTLVTIAKLSEERAKLALILDGSSLPNISNLNYSELIAATAERDIARARCLRASNTLERAIEEYAADAAKQEYAEGGKDAPPPPLGTILTGSLCPSFIDRVKGLLSKIVPVMRAEHDGGGGHFATAEVAEAEDLWRLLQ